MTQHAGSLANQSGASFRADLNNLALALMSNNSGATAPAVTFPYQWWPDTTSGLLKQRNGANSAWIAIGPLADLGIQSGVQTLGTVGGTANAITAAFSPAIATSVNGAKLRFRTAAAITSTTPTFKPDTGTLGTLVKGNNLALALADLPSGYLAEAHWDSTYANYVLDNPATGVAGSGGRVLAQQVLTPNVAFASGSTTTPFDDTIPQNTEGDQYLASAAFVPQNASSELLITVVLNIAGSTNMQAVCALFRDAGANAIDVKFLTFPAAKQGFLVVFQTKVSASSTASTVFKVRIGSNGGTVYLNGNSDGRLFGGVMNSGILIQEYLP